MKLNFLYPFIILFLVVFIYDASAQTMEDRIAMGQYFTPSYQDYHLIPALIQEGCLYNSYTWDDNPYVLIHRTVKHWESLEKTKGLSDNRTNEEIINSYQYYYSGYNPEETYRK
jgi:hypothetical protein